MSDIPAFDSDEWCELRDAKLAEWVGDPYAIAFLHALFDAAEFFDDVIDEDVPLSKAHAIRVLSELLLRLPVNPFFDHYKSQLIPIMTVGLNAWLDANELERGSDNDKALAYVLRDWYMELLAYVVHLIRGPEYLRTVSVEMRHFFTRHESLDEYKRKLV